MVNPRKALQRLNRKIGRRSVSRPNPSLGPNDPSIVRSLGGDRGGNYEWPIHVRAVRGRAGVIELVTTGVIDADRGLIVPEATPEYVLPDPLNLTLGLTLDGKSVANYWSIIHSEDATASGTGAGDFPALTGDDRFLVDLTQFDEARLSCDVQTPASGGNAMRLRWATSHGGSYTSLDGTGSNTLSTTSTGRSTTGWYSISETAQAAGEVFMEIRKDSGGITAPRVKRLQVELRHNL